MISMERHKGPEDKDNVVDGADNELLLISNSQYNT